MVQTQFGRCPFCASADVRQSAPPGTNETALRFVNVCCVLCMFAGIAGLLFAVSVETNGFLIGYPAVMDIVCSTLVLSLFAAHRRSRLHCSACDRYWKP